MAKSPKAANTEAAPAAVTAPGGQAVASEGAAPEAALATTAPAAVRRSAKVPREHIGDQEARSQLDEHINELLGQVAGSDDEQDEGATRRVKTKTKPPLAAHEPEADDESGEDDADDDETDETRHIDANDEIDTDEDTDGPVIPEDDTDDEDDAADGAKTTDEEHEGLTPDQIVSKLETKLFKQREAKRTLQSELDQARQQARELTEKLATLTAQPAGVTQNLGWFQNAKSEEDITNIEHDIEAELEWCEDHRNEGYQGTNAAGEPVEWSPQQVRNYRNQCRAQKKLATRARETLKIATESEAVARRKYPFVFDPAKRLHQRVLDAAKETPGINALPNKALILGRLAIAKMVESGEFQLVKRGAKPGAAANGKPALPAANGKAVTTTLLSNRKPAPPAPPSTSRRQPQGGSDLQDRIANGDRAAYEEWVESLIPA